ncbi:MAG: membrane or secreted protein [Planctomycetaceae bacterium]|nr:MAG: membrane or secreted protein [Planctomycetaceae bacterium]
MSVRSIHLLCALSLVASTGCGRERPNIMHPGDLQSQRFNAIAHDPYTDQDAGPEVVGGRPREFQKPLAEPVRNRWLMDSFWSKR